MADLFYDWNYFWKHEQLAKQFNTKVGEIIFNELNDKLHKFDMWVGSHLAQSKKYASTKISYAWNFSSQLNMLKKYIDYSYQQIEEMGYFEYHTIIIDLFYRVFNYWNEFINKNVDSEIKQRDTIYLKEFMRIRTHWSHPENVHEDREKNLLVLVSFNKSNMFSYKEVMFSHHKLQDDGKISEPTYFGPYDMQKLIKAAAIEISNFSEKMFKIRKIF